MQAYSQIKNHEIQCYKVSADATPVAGDDNDVAAHRIVYQPAELEIDISVDGTVLPNGVTMTGGDIGAKLDVQSGGVAIVEAGEEIAVGDLITAGAGGKGAVAASGEYIIGKAVTPASGDTVLFSVQMEIGLAATVGP